MSGVNRAKDIDEVEEIGVSEVGGLNSDLAWINIYLLFVGILLGSDINIEKKTLGVVFLQVGLQVSM